MVDRIQKTLNDLIEELQQVCKSENVEFSYETKSNILTQVQLSNETKIRIYNTKKGLKIDDSISSNEELVNKIVNKWKVLYYKEQNNNHYTYEEVKNYDKIKHKLLNLKNETLDSNESKTNANGCISAIIIVDKNTHEKITTHFYKSNKLLIQGFTGHLWEKVCRIVEMEEKCDVSDILKRISNESIPTLLNEQENNFKNYKNDFKKYEDELKNILTETVYEFLSNEDKEYLISAQLLIQNGVKFPRYNAILCPACLTLEGYFKKLLVKLKIVKQYEISKSNFNFGWVFDNNHKLPDSKVRLIDSSDSEHKKEIKKVLEKLYLKIKSFRNPACHSSGGMGTNISNIKSFSKCKQVYEDEIVSEIKNSYYKVYKQ